MSENSEMSEQVQVRAAKRQQILDTGRQAYPVELPLTSTIQDIREKYAGLEAGAETDDTVGIAGRVVFARNTGKLCFAMLQAGDGTRLQVMLSAGEIGTESLSEYKQLVDLGDFLFVHGRVISSKRGELSVFATPGSPTELDPVTGLAVPAWQIASKALRPLPKTFTTATGEESELSEETRIRQRYLDMITRPAARDMVRKRYRVVKALRDFMDSRGYIEAETPMLQTIHGGAAARPFITHMNAYDIDLYLRIAPELFLKRCIIGGVDRVFEINRNFRNEGADSSHSPEFSMMEAYEAYGNYNTIGQLTQDLIQTTAREVFGSEVVTLADGSEYDLSGQWQTLDLYETVSEAVGAEVTPETPRANLVAHAQKLGIEVDDYMVNGRIVEEIFETTSENKLYQPTFVRDYPEDNSPLVRPHRNRPGIVEKWDLYVRGFELATGYSELVDPVIQRARFEAQSLAAAKGDPEAMQLDNDFLTAMEQGMPPTGGMGMGLDRLLMALTGLGIRETITFPLVKPIN